MPVATHSTDRKGSTPATLRFEGPEGPPRILSLGKAETMVGRHRGCDLVIDHRSISRQQAKILDSGGQYLLVDLASVNGTFVNGRRIQVCFLRDGDCIHFARCPYRIYFGRDELSHPQDHTAPFGALSAERVAEILLGELRKHVEQHWALDSELRLAEHIQAGLLPEEVPQFHGFRLCACSAPTRYVGGDFYDFVISSEGTLYGVLGDISGKGVGASLLSSMALGCLDAQLRSGSGLENAVGTLNLQLCEKGRARQATLFLFQLHPGGSGRYVSAGHNTAYIYRRATDTVVEISSNCSILGYDPTSTYGSEPFDLGIGDVMLVYSDGLTDAFGPNDELLGEDRVKEVLHQRSAKGALHVKESLNELVEDFTSGRAQADDITLVVIERVG